MKFQKWISMLCLLLSLSWVIPVQSLASQSSGIFQNSTTAGRVYGDLKFYKANYPKLQEKNAICKKQVSNLGKQVDTSNELLTGCETDKKDLLKVSADFQKKYEDTSGELTKCETSKPSRYVWFATGFVSAAILGLVGAFLVSK